MRRNLLTVDAIHDLRTKARTYIDTGAKEAWIVFPRSRRIEFHASAGLITQSAFAIDLGRLSD